jgi:isopenicillin N synthase-like dioxygenase
MEIDTLLRGGMEASAAREVETTLLEDGHLVLTGASLRCVGTALSRWTGFTALPLDIRQRYHQSVRAGEARGGWSLMREHPVYSSHMSAAELESAEPKQEFGFNIETERTLWPDEQTAPGFAASAKAAAELLDATARALLGAFERVLGEAPGFLRHAPAYMALKHYPAQPSATMDEGGLHEHSDAVVFTMLAQSVESLQIRARDGSWLTAPADPDGALVVIPGDWMELFTNGAIPAVRHRVMDTTQPRTSLAFFQNLAPMPVGPLDRFVGNGNPPRYPTVASDIDYVGGDSGVPRWRTAQGIHGNHGAPAQPN